MEQYVLLKDTGTDEESSNSIEHSLVFLVIIYLTHSIMIAKRLAEGNTAQTQEHGTCL